MNPIYFIDKLISNDLPDNNVPCLRKLWRVHGLVSFLNSSVYATGHIKDPVPLSEKRRGLSPGGRFHSSIIQSSYTIMCSRPEDGLICRLGVKLPLKPRKSKNQG